MVNLFAEAVIPLVAISAEVVGVLMPLVLAAIVAVAALIWREMAPHLTPAGA
ncbi:hypothetical protein L2U69_02800 [Zavarzinia compransoris]|uniref:hypothetical protein n=1 Tax=Zavarzinia marina TaxID=2911065 RepID=UPI001F2FB366|nr:hypothetical protein [Zavarzinia marina]MCF4164572.1 hypothetical protein [Zavarzinia marina]